MMKNSRGIRYWAPVILLGGMAFATPAILLEAQSNQSVTQSLLDKARSFETRGRLDLAAQTWQQVLLTDPNNPDALGGLARAAKSDGNTALSNTYLERLRAVNPNDPNIARVENLGAQQNQMAQLQQAGKLAEAGQYGAAMVIYRQVFGTNPPPGDWSLAYYETESATEDGRPHSISGLSALVSKYPNDSRYQVALGRILTYNPRTRDEGRKMLERFPADTQAQEATRQSLLWDSANPAMAPQIRAYLATHRDPQLASALQGVQSGGKQSKAEPMPAVAVSRPTPPAKTPRVAASGKTAPVVAADHARPSDIVAAYKALNAKHVDDAEARFRAILAKEPENAKALAGMGYVRMQQGNFSGAISFLEQARHDNSTDKGLSAALDTSRFWFIMGEGSAALNANDLTTAEKQYRAALEVRPASPEALEGLGGTMLKAQQPAAAIPFFDKETQLKPTSTDAWRDLMTAQFQAGNAPMALATDKRVPPAVHAQLLKDPAYLRTLGSAYSAVGRDADAQTVFATALSLPFPATAKGIKADTQLQLAGSLFSANRLDQAATLYRSILANNHENTAAWQGLVRVEHAMGHDAEAQQTVESMPPANFELAMKDPGFETTVASVYQGQKKLDVAQDLLEKAIAQQTAAGQKPPVSIQMQLAGVYTQRGNAQLAFPIYQQVLAADPNRGDAWAGLLNALHATGHDREAIAQVQQISPAVRAQLETNVGFLQTMGGIYGSLGESQQAQIFVSRVQRYYAAQHTAPPADVDIQNAWLLYNGMNDAGLYGQLMALGGRPDLTDDQRRVIQTIWTNWAVRRANQSAAAGNPQRALAILNAAARSFPDNPAVLKALANGYARAGQPEEAVLIFKAQNMSSASVPDYLSAVGAALSAGDSKVAETWLRFALATHPGDPQILILAARFEQSRGDTNRAISYYHASLKAMPPADPGAQLASELGLPSAVTPSRLPSAAQAQDLSTLLAPGSEGSQSPVQPYLPSYGNVYGQPPTAPMAPMGQPYPAPTAVPQYMTNPAIQPDGRTRTQDYVPPQSSVRSGAFDLPSQAEVALRIQDAVAEVVAADASSQMASLTDKSVVTDQSQATSTESPESYQRQQVARLTRQASTRPLIGSAPSADAYGSFVPYVYPSTPTGTAEARLPQPAAVAIQLGDSTPHPVPPQAEVTDVLPRARYVPNTRGGTPTSSHPEIAAAEAASIRQRQSDAGSAHASLPADAVAASTFDAQYVAQNQGAPLTPQPSLPPSGQNASQGSVPDSGQQQYPQPRTGTPAENPLGRRRVAPRKAKPVPAAIVETPAAPVANQSPAAAPAYTGMSYPGVGQPLYGQPYPLIGAPYPLGAPPTDADLMARNLPPLRGGVNAQAPLPMTPRQEAENALASLEGSYSSWVGGTGIGRYRSGTPGLDRLYDIEAPVEASAMLGHAARLTAVARPVFLNSGVLNTANFNGNYVPYIGTLNANAATPPPQQFSNGLGGELQLTTKNIGLAAGYTPYEFLVRNITGRFRWRPAGGHFTLYADRDSVKDTQLSYAGLHDPGASSLVSSAPIWGGVVATTGGLRMDFGGASGSGIYISGDGGVLRGEHVLQNTKYEGAMGAYFRVKNWPGYGSLTLGGSLFGMHYAHNELGLTYGQGGYFSPDQYFLASVPVTFNGYYKANFHYVIAGAVGVQTFQQDDALFYPLDPALQNSFLPTSGVPCTGAQLAAHSCGQYPVSGNTGFNYGINSEVSYLFGDHWYLGGFVSGNNTNNYNTISGGFFFRYTFKTQHAAEGYPTGLFPVEGFRPVQVP